MTKPSTHPVRVFLALLIAAFVGCAAGIASFPTIIGAVGGVEFGPVLSIEYFKTVGIIWLWTLPISLTFGALAHWALLRLKLWPVTAYTIFGMLLGPAALIAWNFMMTRGHLDLLDMSLTWLGVITGGVTALTFRLLVHRTADSTSFPPPGTRPY